MDKELDYIKLKSLCKAVGISYMKVYNNLRIPIQDTLSDSEKIALCDELDKGVRDFKQKLK